MYIFLLLFIFAVGYCLKAKEKFVLESRGLEFQDLYVFRELYSVDALALLFGLTLRLCLTLFQGMILDFNSLVLSE